MRSISSDLADYFGLHLQRQALMVARARYRGLERNPPSYGLIATGPIEAMVPARGPVLPTQRIAE